MKGYKKWVKFSPFYLKRHPEERTQGDITDIKNMIQTASEEGNDELSVVENIFEKNLNNFNKIV